MRRVTTFILLALLTALSITAAATAGRSDRAPGVKAADIAVCPDHSTAKPQDDRTQGGSGGAGGSADTRDNPNTGGGGGDGNGNGNGDGSPAGEGSTGGGQADAGTRGNGGNENGGRGNGGRGNGGRGNGEGGGTDCVNPPATPATEALAGDGTLPPAKAGTSVNVEAVDGAVGVKEPGSDKFQRLSGSAQIPEGSLVDTRAGVIELTSAAGTTGQQQTAAFTGAKFQVQQRKAKAAVTDLVLRGGDFRGCPRIDHGRRVQQIRNGVIAAKHRKRGKRGKRANRGRRLWGNGRGRFRTRGRWGSATVRGTVWQVEDTCAGTRTTVARGLVKVTDFGLNRTVAVRAGQTYFSKVRR